MKFKKCLLVFDEVLLYENLLWRYGVAPGTLLQGCCSGLCRFCPAQGCWFWVASGRGNVVCVPLTRMNTSCNPFLIFTKLLYGVVAWPCSFGAGGPIVTEPSVLTVSSAKRTGWCWAWGSKVLHVNF